MARPARILAALLALLTVSVALSACGDDSIPGNAVVRIGDETIKRTEFDRWSGIVAKSNAQQTGGSAAVPKPPEFTECVALAKKNAPKPAKGQPKQTDAQFKAQCKQQYEGIRDNVLSQILIPGIWLAGEASDQDIKVSDADVKKEFEKQKKQAFPKDADYQKFLKQSGQTEEDLFFRVRTQLYGDKIKAKVVKGKGTATPAQVQAYYDKNKAQFAQPERRNLLVVLAKDEATAKKAKAEIDGGAKWSTVAKQYSKDEASKSNAAKLDNVIRGQNDAAFDKAVFAAKTGTVEGPVKTQFGYYVFSVRKIFPKSQQPLSAVKAQIEQTLKSEGEQKALDAFVKKFQKKWKDKTDCREGFVVDDCKNAPKKKTSTATTGGAQTAPAQDPSQQPTP